MVAQRVATDDASLDVSLMETAIWNGSSKL
jgi:hypothetical protein